MVKGTVHEGKVRNLLLAGAFGLLDGILMFGTFHGVRFAIFRAWARNSIVDKLGALFESDMEPGDQLLWDDLHGMITVPVPARDIPIDTIIDAQSEVDIVPTDVPVSEVTSSTIRHKAELDGMLALVPLLKGKPIDDSYIDGPVEVWTAIRFTRAREPVTGSSPAADTDILTVTIIGSEDVSPEMLRATRTIPCQGGSAKAKVDLKPGLPLTEGMISEKCFAWAASKPLAAYHVLGGEDLLCLDPATRKESSDATSCDDAFNPEGWMLIRQVAQSALISASDVIAEFTTELHQIAVIVSYAGSVGGSLEPGDIVDLHVAPRVIVTGTVESPDVQVMDISDVAEVFPVTGVVVASVPIDQTEQHMVTLGIRDLDREKLGAIVAAAPRVEFHLVLRFRPPDEEQIDLPEGPSP